MKNFIFLLAYFVFCTFIVSCRDDSNIVDGINSSLRANSFTQSGAGIVAAATFRSNEFHSAIFDQPVENLDPIDKIISTPSVKHFIYDFIPSENKLITKSLKSNKVASFDWNNTIVDWESIVQNGKSFVYSDYEMIGTEDVPENLPIDFLLSLERDLLNSDQIDKVWKTMIEELNASEYNSNTLKFVSQSNDRITEVYLDKESQSISLIKTTNLTGQVKSQRSYFYKVENKKATLKSEIFESYETSINIGLPFRSVNFTEFQKI